MRGSSERHNTEQVPNRSEDLDEPSTPLPDEIGDDSEVSVYTSSDDSEADRGRRRRKTTVTYRPTKQQSDIPYFESGMIFKSAKEFKNAVVDHSLKVHREVEFAKNDKTRVRAKCADASCKWLAYASRTKDMDQFELVTYKPDHTCYRKFTNSRANYKVIADYFIKTRRDSALSMKAKEIKLHAKQEMGIEITPTQSKNARSKIVKHFLGDYDSEFIRIWDFVKEVRVSNPGSTVVLDCPDNQFKRMYICYDAVKKGFIAGCRHTLGVDGCFLKGPFKQQLLSAVGRDGNDQMYPVAWAVVDVENHSNWLWFMDLVKKDLEIADDGAGWTLQSDQHPVSV